jgi:hypothetical protein
MSSGITEIGRCIGCDQGPRRLDRGVCHDCLSHPKRGRRWAEHAKRCRTEPEFALRTWNEIGGLKPEKALAGKLLFIRMFGVPKGAEVPPELQRFVEDRTEEPEDPRPLRLVR